MMTGWNIVNGKTLALLAATVLTGVAQADPLEARASNPDAPFSTPDVTDMHWQLHLTWGTPRVVEVLGKPWWYLPFEVVNHGDETVLFQPLVDVVTDSARVHLAGKAVPITVYDAIRAREADRLVVDYPQVAGQVRPGEDHARVSALVWPVEEDDVDGFTVFFGGLSGEAEYMLDPVSGEPLMVDLIDPITGEPIKDIHGEPIRTKRMVHRTRVLRFKCGGTTAFPEKPEAILVEDNQVMR